MSMRFSARAGVRPRRCPVPCPETETVGFICHHACPPCHLRLFYGLCTYIESGSLPEGLFPPGSAHSPPSSYTGVSGVRNRVRISWRYRMATGSVRVPSVIVVGIACTWPPAGVSGHYLASLRVVGHSRRSALASLDRKSVG